MKTRLSRAGCLLLIGMLCLMPGCASLYQEAAFQRLQVSPVSSFGHEFALLGEWNADDLKLSKCKALFDDAVVLLNKFANDENSEHFESAKRIFDEVRKGCKVAIFQAESIWGLALLEVLAKRYAQAARHFEYLCLSRSSEAEERVGWCRLERIFKRCDGKDPEGLERLRQFLARRQRGFPDRWANQSPLKKNSCVEKEMR